MLAWYFEVPRMEDMAEMHITVSGMKRRDQMK